MSDEMRQAFEKWAASDSMTTEKFESSHPSWPGQYVSFATDRTWLAWKAACAYAAGAEWQPIASAPKGRKLIVGYKNRAGKWRTVMARYFEPNTLDSEFTQSGWADEGWYEESETYETLMPCDEEPTHWKPLPPAPEQP